MQAIHERQSFSSAAVRETVGRRWCVLMHDSAMWPIHGQYRCRACGREFPAIESTDRLRAGVPVRSAAVSAIRSALLPLAFVLVVSAGAPIRAGDLSAVTTTVVRPDRSEFSAGRAYYAEGEFEKAAAHFRRAVEADPENAQSNYWLGRSYEILADLAAPLDVRRRSKARLYLTRAVELDPSRPEYRRELFDFLLDGSDSSASIRQAGEILRSAPESDPDYLYMRDRLESERRGNSSMQARVGTVLITGPRAAYRIREVPGSFRGILLPEGGK
jgi:tetratricopeptide (TPR) repeat protein